MKTQKITFAAILAFCMIFSNLHAQQNVQQKSQNAINVSTEYITIEKTDFLRLIEISDEYVKLQSVKQIQTELSIHAPTIAKIKITLAKDLKHSNDLVYESYIKFNAEIENIESGERSIIVKFKKDTVGNVSSNWFKPFITGLFSGSVTTIIVVLIIVL